MLGRRALQKSGLELHKNISITVAPFYRRVLKTFQAHIGAFQPIISQLGMQQKKNTSNFLKSWRKIAQSAIIGIFWLHVHIASKLADLPGWAYKNNLVARGELFFGDDLAIRKVGEQYGVFKTNR